MRFLFKLPYIRESRPGLILESKPPSKGQRSNDPFPSGDMRPTLLSPPPSLGPRQGSQLLLSCECSSLRESKTMQNRVGVGGASKQIGRKGEGSPSKGRVADCVWGSPGQERESEPAARTRFLLHPVPGQGMSQVYQLPSRSPTSSEQASQKNHQQLMTRIPNSGKHLYTLPALDGDWGWEMVPRTH